MTSLPRHVRLEKAHERSYTNLKHTQQIAAKKSGYNSIETRRSLRDSFSQRFGREPYDWQLDVTEAILLGVDTVLIAGTGAGKTIPFMMPLLLKKNKLEIIVSPLKVLQKDQMSRFRKMNIPAVAVNGDTWNPAMLKDLEEHRYQAILTSPEMCLEHPQFKKWLTSKETTENILAVIVDEAHCISQWGGDFRPTYALLDKLRSFMPPDVPILAASATLPPSALSDVCSKLNIDITKSFFLNLGNDRPNITTSVLRMKNSTDYGAIFDLLPHAASPNELPKTIVFTNSVNETQTICRKLRERYPSDMHASFDFLHAHRTAKAKRNVMKKFRNGEIKVLIATEAAGMGADIPDIELVIQFGIPSSLSVWIQRAGRAGRSPNIQARAVLLVEESMFRRKKKRKQTEKGDGSESDDSGSGTDEESDIGDVDDNEKEWVKKVEEALRRYVEANICRRDVADDYFDNPPRRQVPTGTCCDRCTENMAREAPPAPGINSHDNITGSIPNTILPSSVAPSTPSEHRNRNGKRPMLETSTSDSSTREFTVDGPATRRGDHLKNVRSALESWRFDTKMHRYSPSSFTAAVILPDKNLTTLASKRLKNLDDLKAALNPPWVFADRHGQEILDLLKKMDEEEKDDREKAKRVRRDTKKRETEARREEAKQLKMLEKATQRSAAAPPPLVGSSSFNLALSTQTSYVPQLVHPLPQAIPASYGMYTHYRMPYPAFYLMPTQLVPHLPPEASDPSVPHHSS